MKTYRAERIYIKSHREIQVECNGAFVIRLPYSMRDKISIGDKIRVHTLRDGKIAAYSFGNNIYYCYTGGIKEYELDSFGNRFRGIRDDRSLDRFWFNVALVRNLAKNRRLPTPWFSINMAMFAQLQKNRGGIK
ncbi:MAG: hypothetical protein IJ560_03995 [Alphaproteobacteria bacterium]|nr:hypothetical protein [Alphaproteobacteria bacterium]